MAEGLCRFSRCDHCRVPYSGRPQLGSETMPRYFFHIDEKRHHIDTEGIDLPGFEAAQREAMVIAGKSMIDNAASAIWSDGAWSLTVADEAAQELFVVRLSTQCRIDAGSR